MKILKLLKKLFTAMGFEVNGGHKTRTIFIVHERKGLAFQIIQRPDNYYLINSIQRPFSLELLADSEAHLFFKLVKHPYFFSL